MHGANTLVRWWCVGSAASFLPSPGLGFLILILIKRDKKLSTEGRRPPGKELQWQR